VFSKSSPTIDLPARARPVLACLGLALPVLAACAGPQIAPPETPQVFYTVTGEIALARGEPRVAALQYTAAAKGGTDSKLMARASEVTSECLQPSLTAAVAARWISLDPHSIDAHRTAARAALALARIDESAKQYHVVLVSSPRGTDAELEDLETELGTSDNVFGARQLADRLAASFPSSAAALRLQGFAALRADDPAAAAADFTQALAVISPPASGEPAQATEARRELRQGLWRARILAGDSQEPLAEARALVQSDASPANVLDYALLLLAAQQNQAAVTQLEALAREPDSQPVALRLLGLIEFQQNDLDAASRHFTELLTTGKFIDDSFYYLGLIAERQANLEKALRLYAQVQSGDNAVAALLRASAILQAHGAAAAAQEILDHLVLDEPEHAPEVLAARAKMYSDTGDAVAALAVLDRGRLQYPDSVDLRYAIASTEEDAGRVSAALEELKEVVKLRPEDPAALNAYGYTLADHNRELGRARAFIERAYAAAPRNAAILDSLGWVLYRQGHPEQALPHLAAAYADDRGADIGAHYGEVLWRLDRHAEADKVWDEAAAIDKDSRLLNATRQRLHAAP
jgi:tetratricopeptide (TPR) repeat protein